MQLYAVRFVLTDMTKLVKPVHSRGEYSAFLKQNVKIVLDLENTFWLIL